MKVKSESDLIVIVTLSALLILIISVVPSNDLRIVLGLPFILFFPGYTFVTALFPKKTDLGGIERLALSLGLSIAVVPLIGLILNYTPWGIDLYPILASIAVFIAVAAVGAWYRRGRLPDEERYSIDLNANLPQWAAIRGWDRVLSIILVASMIGAIGIIAYVIVTPTAGERYTEFYVLGPEGEAGGYPLELKVGEEGQVILGIISHEHEDGFEYRVEVLVDGEVNKSYWLPTLNHDEKWEQEIGFIPEHAWVDQTVEFMLYRDGEEVPYETLYFTIDVSNSS